MTLLVVVVVPVSRVADHYIVKIKECPRLCDEVEECGLYDSSWFALKCSLLRLKGKVNIIQWLGQTYLKIPLTSPIGNVILGIFWTIDCSG